MVWAASSAYRDFKRYRQLGGEIITVGADAHKPNILHIHLMKWMIF